MIGEVMIKRALYFGCWSWPGHYLYLPNGLRAYEKAFRLPFSLMELGGGLCPNPTSRQGFPTGPQVQGSALVHHRDGWTALAFWDRSRDARTNSCSVFVLEGVHAFAQARGIARALFPDVCARFRFDIVEAPQPTPAAATA